MCISLEGDAGISLQPSAGVFKTFGIAYPVWTGIGAVGTVLAGIFFFHEPVTFWRMFFTFTLIASIVGLKVLS
ncbi:MAG: hypothetical protein J6B97_07405 [Bacteroidales bacterium]|nr:hypothetical protein [Bacteroidales bacterium]